MSAVASSHDFCCSCRTVLRASSRSSVVATVEVEGIEASASKIELLREELEISGLDLLKEVLVVSGVEKLLDVSCIELLNKSPEVPEDGEAFEECSSVEEEASGEPTASFVGDGTDGCLLLTFLQ